MASTPEGRKKLGPKAPPAAVAKEYLQADKGRHFGRAQAKKGK